MSDDELRALAADLDDLTDEARDTLRAELARRKLPERAEEEASAADANTDSIDPATLETIGQFRDLQDADLAKGLLESAGIECFIADDNLVRMDWFYSNAVGGVKLLVRRQDAEEAIQILEQPIPESFESDTGEYEQPRCPKCGSLDVGADQVELTPFPPQPPQKCFTCGARWIDEPDDSATTHN